MSDEIDISGLDKVELLKRLWINIKPASFFTNRPDVSVPSFNEGAAKDAVKKYIDYFQGRAIKMDLSGDEINRIESPHYTNPDRSEHDLQVGEGIVSLMALGLPAIRKTVPYSTFTDGLSRATKAVELYVVDD